MDIVDQLRADTSAVNVGTGKPCPPALMTRAANEIETLRRVIYKMHLRLNPVPSPKSYLDEAEVAAVRDAVVSNV